MLLQESDVRSLPKNNMSGLPFRNKMDRYGENSLSLGVKQPNKSKVQENGAPQALSRKPMEKKKNVV